MKRMLIAFYALLALLILGAFVFEGRVWGFHWWHYLPLWSVGVMAVTAAIFQVWWSRLVDQLPGTESSESQLSWLHLGLISAAMLILFVVARNTTHFLGDGYTLLKIMLLEDPIVKIRNYGGMILQLLITRAQGADSVEDSRIAFQIVSWTAGLIYMGFSALLVRRYLSGRWVQLLGFLFLISGGYALMFFGYVENYSLFAGSLLLFCIAGLEVFQRGRSVWLIVGAYLLAQFFHIFGATLLPAVGYALLMRTPPGRFVLRLPLMARVALTGTALVLLTIFFIQRYSSDFFLHISIVPLFVDRFTTSGYTLFSSDHLLDLLNLFLMVVPGAMILIMAILKKPPFANLGSDLSFLAVTVLGCIGGAAIMNPGLGMPRDWDLFSFFGTPLAVWLLVLITRSGITPRLRHTALGLGITINLLFLFPRVIIQNDTPRGIALLRNYLVLDKVRNKNTYGILSGYYRDLGDTVNARQAVNDMNTLYPEIALAKEANQAYRQGNYRESIRLSHMGTQLNPLFWDAYGNIGTAYHGMGMRDSALHYLGIANELNGFNSDIVATIGMVHYFLGERGLSREFFDRAIKIDRNNFRPHLMLAHLALDEQKLDSSRYYLDRSAASKTPDGSMFGSIGTLYLERQAIPLAAAAFQHALAMGVDTNAIRPYIQQYPILRQYGLDY